MCTTCRGYWFRHKPVADFDPRGARTERRVLGCARCCTCQVVPDALSRPNFAQGLRPDSCGAEQERGSGAGCRSASGSSSTRARAQRGIQPFRRSLHSRSPEAALSALLFSSSRNLKRFEKKGLQRKMCCLLLRLNANSDACSLDHLLNRDSHAAAAESRSMAWRLVNAVRQSGP